MNTFELDEKTLISIKNIFVDLLKKTNISDEEKNDKIYNITNIFNKIIENQENFKLTKDNIKYLSENLLKLRQYISSKQKIGNINNLVRDDATLQQIKNIEIFLKSFNNYKAMKSLVPRDYKDEYNKIESFKRAVSFTTKRLGLTLDDGVNRFIFKNQDYLRFFDKDFLLYKGYFSNEDEYNNYIDKIYKKNNDKKDSETNKKTINESEIGTNTIVTLFDDKKNKIIMNCRIKNQITYQGTPYYILEYKRNKNAGKNIESRLSNAFKSGLKSTLGMTNDKEILKSIEWEDEKPRNEDEIKTIYLEFEYPIPANLVKKVPIKLEDKFYRLNDEMFIPFENPNFFAVFHILKYSFKKALNVGRINKLYYILKTFKDKLKSSEDYYNYYKKKELPVIEMELKDNNDFGKNIKDAEKVDKNASDLILGKFYNTLESEKGKEVDDDNEYNNSAISSDTMIGGKKTKKNKQTNRKTRKNEQSGGLSTSMTKGGRIKVIIDKITKYIFTQNLKSKIDDSKLNSSMLGYIIEEQRNFLKAAIYYFGKNIKLEDITYEKYDIEEINKYINGENLKEYNTLELIEILSQKVWPERQYGDDITDDFEKTRQRLKEGFDKKKEIVKNINIKENISKASTFLKEGINEIYKKKIALNNKESDNNNNNNKSNQNKEIVKNKNIKENISKASTFLKEGINEIDKNSKNNLDKLLSMAFKNNIKLNRIFDIAFRKMVDRKIDELFIEKPSSSSNQVPYEIYIKQVVKFYSAILFSSVSASHFTCSTALNITAGVLSNPLAFLGASIPGLPVLPPFLKTLTSANTPQCYVSSMLFLYIVFRMWRL
jgi:hypothetical protein